MSYPELLNKRDILVIVTVILFKNGHYPDLLSLINTFCILPIYFIYNSIDHAFGLTTSSRGDCLSLHEFTEACWHKR